MNAIDSQHTDAALQSRMVDYTQRSVDTQGITLAAPLGAGMTQSLSFIAFAMALMPLVVPQDSITRYIPNAAETTGTMVSAPLAVVTEFELLSALSRIHDLLAVKSKALIPEAREVLYRNLWDLYM